MSFAIVPLLADIGITGLAADVISFAISMVASTIISSLFAPKQPGLPNLPNPGNPQQVPPSGNNLLPILYGEAYVGGIITDLSITSDNQDIYWVIALSEVTNTETGGTPDTITFGNIYWGGRKVIFNGSSTPTIISIGSVTAWSSSTPNQITMSSSIATSLQIGDELQFGPDTSYTRYTIGQINQIDATDYLIIFTASLVGVSTGSTVYQYYFASDTNSSQVTGLLDESTGNIQDVTGYMDIYLYKNGSNQPVNTTQSAISVMQSSGLVYTWDSSKLMSNCAFAIVHLKYNSSLNLTGLAQTRFQIINSRSSPGDCFLDFLTSTRYGAAVPVAQIDTNSLIALNTYSNGVFTFTGFDSVIYTQSRFQFNGTLDSTVKVLDNLQNMASCCDCLVKYNEILGLWGVVVQTPVYTPVMDINNSNIISSISVTPIDLTNTFNVAQCQYPDGSNQNSFASVTFNLATIDPTLLFPNEPVNQQTINLYLTNNNVTVQYLANRFLKSCREDLQVQLDLNYVGIQLEAGDIVTVTNVNYGWAAKLFRVSKVIEKFGANGQVTATLTLMEYNPSVYDDVNITQFTPASNTGIGNPSTFSALSSPTIVSSQPNVVNPSFGVSITTPTTGIVQYAEIWYSAYPTPTSSQYIFAGTTSIQPAGNPFIAGAAIPTVTLTGIPSGDWYFFSRMVNSLAKSAYSPASTVFNWRPTTFQYTQKYLSVAYADDTSGTNFSLHPVGRLYYGLANQATNVPSTTPSDYTWYLANPTFGTGTGGLPLKYLAYINRTGRLFSFATDNANYAAGTAQFVPTTSSLYDFTLWSALPDGTNIIDLDQRTGQTIATGTTSTGAGEVSVINTTDGQVVAALQQFLDFGGPSTFTASTVASLTIDVYGRVVGFTQIDEFFMTISQFVATASQTVFSVTRDSTYIQGQCLVFENGILLQKSDYTDTGGSTGTVTLATGATLGDNITIISMRAISSAIFYDNTHITVGSISSNVVTWNTASMPYNAINIGDQLAFANTGSPTLYTVTGINYTTAQITFSSAVTGVSAGAPIYTYRAASSSYPVFTRYSQTVTNASSYTPTLWNFDSGYELPFINGAAINAYDYNLAGNTYYSTPDLMTGNLDIIQFTGNNVTTPTGNYTNVVAYTVTGQLSYTFTSIANAFNLFMNGALLVNGTDYTSTTSNYNLTNYPTNNTTILQQQTFARYGAA